MSEKTPQSGNVSKKGSKEAERMRLWEEEQANDMRTFETGTAAPPRLVNRPSPRSGYTAGLQSAAMDKEADERERRARIRAGLPPDIEID